MCTASLQDTPSQLTLTTLNDYDDYYYFIICRVGGVNYLNLYAWIGHQKRGSAFDSHSRQPRPLGEVPGSVIRVQLEQLAT